MNITNKDYFTFNVDNSVLLVGQTGSGKTELVRQLIRRLESAYSPNEMKYVIYDLKCCEFYTHGINGEMNLNGAKEEYLYTSVRSGTPAGFDYLDELAVLAKNRAAQENPTPMLFIYIEECDLAATDQARFDKAVITINRHAKQANMKLIYSTSRPAPDVVSKEIIASFDLILSGSIHSRVDAKHLGIPYRNNVDPYSFLVTQHDDIYDANGIIRSTMRSLSRS